MSEPDSDSDYQDVVDTTNDEQQVDTDSVSVGPIQMESELGDKISHG